jgi:mutator protein MutT
MIFDYCPHCGSNAVTKHDDTRYACRRCGQKIYNNPHAAVAVVFLRGGEALFSKRGIDPNKGKYDFPGGFIEHGEDPYGACVREVAEETGVTVEKDDLILATAYTHEYLPGVSATDLIFVVNAWSGDFVAADDSAALEWKPLSFIETNEFVPSYAGLAPKLRNFSQTPL